MPWHCKTAERCPTPRGSRAQQPVEDGLYVPPPRSVVVAAAHHLEPVQLLFHAVEGVLADLVAVAHGEDGLAGGVDGATVQLGVRGRGEVPGVGAGVLVG